MIQDQLFAIQPVERNKYRVIHNNKRLTAWFMGGVFVFPNYRTETDCEVLQRIGNEREVFE